MQPYFFPYIAYYQLFAAVDYFVILDDVNFIKNGWIHRNRLLRQGEERLFTMAVNSASSFKPINKLSIFKAEDSKKKILDLVLTSYQQAAFYELHSSFISNIILFNEENLSRYLSFGLHQIAAHFHLKPRIIMSSDIPKNPSLSGQNRIIDICKNLGATRYINSIGGISLYDENTFEKNAIELRFLRTKSQPYQQFGGTFIPNLSIIDVMMFNSIQQIQDDLSRFELLSSAQAKQ